MRAYVGADWSANSVVCATGAESGKPRNIRGASPSMESVRDLLKRVRVRYPVADEVHVVLESGDPGWPRLFDAAGAIVHVVDAKQSKKFAESLSSSGAKADRRDARTLVHLLRSPAHCPPVWKPTPELEVLETLSAAREQSLKEHTRAIQQLRSVLREHMPLVERHLTLTAQWVFGFLREVPTPRHATGIDYATFSRVTKRCHEKRRQDLWEALQQTEAIWMTEGLAEMMAMRVSHLLDRLELIAHQLRDLDTALDKASASMGARDLLESVGGIGLQTAVLLLVFAFGTKVLRNRDQVATQMGASPVFIGSGTYKDGEPKGHAIMRRAGNYRARRGSYMLGRLAQQNLGWAKAMFKDAKARGQSAATAYRRIARSLLRILTAMVRDGERYDDARYVAALKARGVKWAVSL